MVMVVVDDRSSVQFPDFQLCTMSLNGLFAIRKPAGIGSTQVLNAIQPLLKSSNYFKDHLTSRDAPGKRTKRRRLDETKVKVATPWMILT
jgi:tRNA U55 pseudouridine synthase TruB